jgi:hypothetical protein
MGIALKTVTVDQLEKFRERLARSAPKPPEDEAEPDEGYVPGDPLAMRGVPLVGVHGVGGVIAGTRPGDPSWRLAKDEAYLRARAAAARRRSSDR